MKAALVAGLLGLWVTQTMAGSTLRQDALVAGYFAIWDDDSHVTPDNIARLYAARLIYYGHPMTRESLLRDKLAFIRRWPKRRYAVEPGTASKTCNTSASHCVISATLDWRTIGAGGMRAGRSRVTLTLGQEAGGLKIVREGAVTLSR